MSSLSTLLEAARFLELQEQEQQHRATVEAALATMEPMSPSSSSTSQSSPERIIVSPDDLKTVTANSSPQTVVISSNNISSTLLQGPITFSSTSNTNQQVVKKIDQDGQVTSTTPVGQLPRHCLLHNSFDIINPLVIDETNGNDLKRKQPPMVFRAGTREVHNKLEKHRRAHLKECFDILKKQLPATQDEKKVSNLSILHSALRYIQTLKRKERELEHEMERLAREKISAQQRLAVLKKEIASHCDNVDFSKILPEMTTTTQSVGSGSDTVIESRSESITITAANQVNTTEEKLTIPILAKTNVPVVTQALAIKEPSQQQPLQPTSLSVVPVTYPTAQGVLLQKLFVPGKPLDGLVQTFVTPQQINAKIVPLTQYLVKPLVVVSTASPRPS